ncbi:MAG: hypothetical protein A2747_03795 [Candidatus Yonathbacteria bacterium RIFCSPHIGHO2_01_FULL_44_41]|uniref:HD domain-containing protein n=1 Tax=Candidatus Yonathbacteria bacterium RIFCSPHIGHO2_02_FULL_44_14 TaxID=1802724 RepID=A0A1G2S7F0_9BACT|nr:MAG: hypothetical protein A2747_03795 [Candidatus Yonathbacteria bacterium RIFCSPHIGHO2_01_FULL_44_41]OHA81044.1 MAG: hypothetical protein A3D51_01685 [Candidatus Yonathbacteria bacterium RIFCSPHIGHO2_02_FULL_44_14]
MTIETIPEAQDLEKDKLIDPRAYEVADCGNYAEIVNTLTKENLLNEEIERVQDCYKTTLEHAVWMTEKDWEMLTVMDCYDNRTAHHCVETLRIAEDRIERFKAGGKKFSELIKDEEVPLDEFFRACLFHDIGKCLIPRAILNNSFFDEDFDTQLCNDIFRGGKKEFLAAIEKTTGHIFEGEGNDMDLREYLRTNHVHTMRYVPAIEMLSEEDINVARERFPSLNFSKATLADILEFHEENSENILLAQGFDMAANIAGKHHNYRKLEMRFPVSTDILGVTIALEELLTLSDMKQALSAKRSYKNSLNSPLILHNLIFEAERHEISPVITSLWVEQELALISSEERRGHDEQTIFAIHECEEFIKKHQSLVEDFVNAIQNKTVETSTY